MEVSLGVSLGWMKEARQSQSPSHAQAHHNPALQLHLSHFSLSMHVLWPQYSKAPSHALMFRAGPPNLLPIIGLLALLSLLQQTFSASFSAGLALP